MKRAIAFDTAEMRRMNRALGYLHLFVKKLSQIGKHWFWFGGKKKCSFKTTQFEPEGEHNPLDSYWEGSLRGVRSLCLVSERTRLPNQIKTKIDLVLQEFI